MRTAGWGGIVATAVGAVLLAGCGAGTVASVNPAGGAGAVVHAATGTASSAGNGSAATSGTAAAAGSVGNGTFTIDDASSTASYTAHETFLQQNSPFTPVGKSSAITGTLVLQNGKIGPSTVTVDLRTLRTDNAMRDRHIQQDPLQTGTYPSAVFAITGVQGSAPQITSGDPVSLKLTGNMTIHGATKPMVWDAKVDLEGGDLHLTGSTSFNLPDFGMQPPDIPGFVSVKPGIELSVDFTAKA